MDGVNMSNAKNLHSKAMNLAEDAFIADKRGKHFSAYWKFKRALRLEEKALANIPATDYYEHTRFVLGLSVMSITCHVKRSRCNLVDAAVAWIRFV